MATSTDVLALIRQQLPVALGSAREATEAKVAEATEGAKVAGQVEERMRTAAEDAALIARTQGLARLNTQRQNQLALRAAGVDTSTGANVLLDTIGNLQTQAVKLNEVVQARAEQQERQRTATPRTSFRDFAKAFIGLDEYAPELQARTQAVQALQQTAVGLNNTLQETFATNLAAEESLTVASVEATSRQAALEFDVRAKEAALQGLRYNSAAIQAIADLDEKRLGMLYNARSAEMAEQNHKLSLEQMQMQRERMQWERIDRENRRTAEETGRRVDQIVLDKINMSRAARGAAPISGPEAQSVIEMFRRGQASDEMQFDYQNGNRITATGVPMVGASPVEALENLQRFASNLPEVMQETTGILAAAQRALAETKDIRLRDPKNTEGRRSFINEFVQAEVQRQYSRVTPESGNLFHIGDLRAYMGIDGAPTLPIVARMPTVQKVLLPAAQSGVQLSNPQSVLRLVGAAVDRGEVSSVQAAADLANMYRVANLSNQNNRGFNRLGIVLPKDGKQYVVPFGRSGATVDMTSFEEVSRALATQNLSQFQGIAPVLGMPFGIGSRAGSSIRDALTPLEPR